jgi:hypothetical protein
MTAQRAHDCGDVIFLEEADGGDAGCSGAQAGFGVLQSYPSECENRDFGAAGLAESVEAGGSSSGCVPFFEQGSEDGESGAICGGLGYFF